MAEPPMPSKVMDKKLVQMPEGDVVDSDEEWDRCGKWMLHHPQKDLEFLDLAWAVLQQLLADGTLIMLKASTGLVAESGTSIYCFTRPGKQEARRAARAIRKVLDFSGILYYKPNNNQAFQGFADRFGDRNASIYMQTLCGGFYSKMNGAWIQDDEDVIGNILPIASKFCKEIYSGNEDLPSTYTGLCFLKLPSNHQYKQTGCANWYLFCSCEDGGNYLPTVDRVWLVAKQLFEEGLFVGITLRKLENGKCAEVRLYVSQDCDVHSRLTACDRILEESSYRSIVYFAEKTDQSFIPPERFRVFAYDYKYTSQGELYRRTQYSEERVILDRNEINNLV